MTNPVLDSVELDRITKSLANVGDSDTILSLFKKAHEEQLANIRRAGKNAMCKRVEDMEPYEGEMFSALLRSWALSVGPGEQPARRKT